MQALDIIRRHGRVAQQHSNDAGRPLDQATDVVPEILGIEAQLAKHRGQRTQRAGQDAGFGCWWVRGWVGVKR